MSEAMDVARGGHYESVPNQYPENAWYTYYDTTCEYECMATEYIYWAVNSWVGALENQEDRIKDEWRPNTRYISINYGISSVRVKIYVKCYNHRSSD